MDNCQDTPNRSAKVPFDPGWNDPPTMSYNSQQTIPGRPRNFLNKRVAFPLAGNSPSQNPPPINLPTLPTAVLSVPPSCHIPKSTEDGDVVTDSDSLLQEVREVLLQFLDDSTELGPKSNDIKRRIGLMDDMWSNGKLNDTIKLRMKNLACALRDDEPSKADEIHRALMVDYVSIVGTWMPGVKQLVHHCIARSELLAIDKETL